MVFIHIDHQEAPLERRERQDASQNGTPSPDDINHYFGFVCIILLVAILISTFFLIRRYRKHITSDLLLHKGDLEAASGHHRSTNPASPQPSFVVREKEAFIASTFGPPTGTPPAIHLTLPGELDDGTKCESDRVVVVSIGEHGEVGLSPLVQEQLPPYKEHASERFQSLDLERLGGLKETEQK